MDTRNQDINEQTSVPTNVQENQESNLNQERMESSQRGQNESLESNNQDDLVRMFNDKLKTVDRKLDDLNGSILSLSSKLEGSEQRSKVEKETISIEELTSEKWNYVQNSLRLETKVSKGYQFPKDIPQIDSVYQWKDNSVYEQINDIISYLNSNLTIGDGYAFYNITGDSNFLFTSHQELPFSFRGGSNIVIAKKNLSKDVLDSQILFIIRIKKNELEIDESRHQAECELILASLKSHLPVVSIVTDLGDNWRFRWMIDNHVVNYYNIKSMSQAQELINMRVRTTGSFSTMVHPTMAREQKFINPFKFRLASSTDFLDSLDGSSNEEHQFVSQHLQSLLVSIQQKPQQLKEKAGSVVEKIQGQEISPQQQHQQQQQQRFSPKQELKESSPTTLAKQQQESTTTPTSAPPVQ
ncbi:hypothetical protein PPL_10652 [Heterostelium album PN500]|uniref:Uncharacterized protein n=1 Tax=Heterostelium pallidum (strain ATCC 26659 / Pp 5 / PN500) TaxID=670386 RepID=D3BRP1_HETP5|nr:hypothetical protein PPL_10652 [Heterostelium album PN500]EFA76073.1 hypothetical protein PPL_10652 [Heterostelium album PN500]|eukprot:XP_020428207.1 hypothetical protein PPL_10652 [Heterostelium album PN500]